MKWSKPAAAASLVGQGGKWGFGFERNTLPGNPPIWRMADKWRESLKLAHAKKQYEFSIQDVVKWMPDVPRRTVERDVAILVKKRALKPKAESKARIYSLAKWRK